jgi:glycosyltransferase involved in cell wall biosynthesis
MTSDRISTLELDILILGPVPPPFGGISMHLLRLVPLLDRAGFRVGVLNHLRSTKAKFVVGALNRNPLNYYRLPKRFRARIVHYHHSRWPHLVAVALGRGNSSARYILTIHAGDIHKHFPQLVSKVPLVSRITVWALRRFDTVIAVDPKIASILEGHLDGQRVEVLPAFLESVPEEPDKYETSIEAFLDSGRVMIVAAYGVQFLQDGGEIYGLDTAVEAFTNLAREQQDLQLAVFIARRPLWPKGRRHLARLERRLELAGVRDRVLILFDLPLLPAFRRNVVFVRPTRAEGDAVSIREAQRAGVPVVASNVVPRPEDVVSFPVESVPDLCASLRVVLDTQTPQPAQVVKSGVHEPSDESFSKRLIGIYRAELATQARARR